MIEDSWQHLRCHTSARIALGRAGGSLPTAEVLAFAAAHAAAQDAVHAEFDLDRLESDLKAQSLDGIRLQTAAPDRQTYLHRPDLGRRLSDASANSIQAADPPPDVALIVSDGLSAPAAQTHASSLLGKLVPLLRSSSIRTSPVYLVRLARVAIEDEIGQRVGAQAAIILLGERPGLGSPDSLGAYLVYGPRIGRTDADRNCVSNIRPAGLPIVAAAQTLHYLIVESLRRKISGVMLKDERAAFPPHPTAAMLK
jgi:ethanolamine ammonia-lyase small subunit